MAFQQGIATSKEDFVDKLTTFAAANGWTLDEFNTTDDQATIHINSVYLTLRWDGLSSGGIAVFQHLDFNQEAVSATVGSGGTGYTVGDDITVAGGTSTVQAVFNVDSVSGGVVTAVSLVTAGNYTALPANPAATSGGTGTGCTLNVTYRGVAPGSHDDDSGNGDEAGAIDTERRMSDIGNGPYANHWFFASDEGGSDYLYAVLEYSPGFFRMLGAGEMVKFGTWTGGEFVGAVSHSGTFEANDSRHNYLYDGAITTAGDAATLHTEGLPGQTASKWSIAANLTPAAAGNDGDANLRNIVSGGSREGVLPNIMQGIPANPNSGGVFMWPLLSFYRSGGSGQNFRFLGKLPHVRELNGKLLVPGEEFTIGGSETWKVFPWVRRATSGEKSGNAYVAIRKIT